MRNPLASAAYRVALLYSVAFVLLVVLLGVGVYFAFHAALIRQLDAGTTNESVELERAYDDGGVVALTRAIAEREQAGSADDLGYALFDPAGRRIAGRLDTTVVTPGTRDIMFVDPKEGPDPARADVRKLGNGMTLIVAADREPIEKTNEIMVSLLLATFVAVLIIAVVGGFVLGGYLQRRLGRISSAAQAIMAGDLGQRIVQSPRGDEFDQLAGTLNEMLDRIGALLVNLQQVSSDIAHDLRTPLSRMRTKLEGILEDGGSRDARTIEEMLDAVDELLALFAAILRISEIESGQPRHSFLPFDLSALVQEICQSYAPAIEDNGRYLHWEVSPRGEVNGDRELLAQAVINLIENAQKHTPAGTRIDVTLTSIASGIRIVVADNGPGVDEEDRARITGRFIRLEAARTTPGNGLGLNLVSAIVALHGGVLTFEDNTPGLRAVIALRLME